DQGAHHGAKCERGNRNNEGGLRSDDDPAQNISAEVVGPEEIMQVAPLQPGRREETQPQVLLVEWYGGQPLTEDRYKDEQTNHEELKQWKTAQVAPGEPSRQGLPPEDGKRLRPDQLLSRVDCHATLSIVCTSCWPRGGYAGPPRHKADRRSDSSGA